MTRYAPIKDGANRLLCQAAPACPAGRIRCRPRLGGLLNYYAWRLRRRPADGTLLVRIQERRQAHRPTPKG